MEDVQNQLWQADELAGEIFRLSRNTLMINMRFLDVALLQFIPACNNLTANLATDGQYFYYNAWHVLRTYKAGREIITRDYLHVALHCVFRHSPAPCDNPEDEGMMPPTEAGEDEKGDGAGEFSGEEKDRGQRRGHIGQRRPQRRQAVVVS